MLPSRNVLWLVVMVFYRAKSKETFLLYVIEWCIHRSTVKDLDLLQVSGSVWSDLLVLHN